MYNNNSFIWLAVLSTLIAIVVAYPLSINYAPNPRPHTPNITDVSWETYFETFGTIMFSFGGHAGFPSYQKNMHKYYKYFDYSLMIGYAYIFVAVVPFAVSMGLLYGNSVEPNILDNLPNNKWAIIIIILITTHMTTSLATLVPPVADILSSFVRVSLTKKNKNIIHNTNKMEISNDSKLTNNIQNSLSKHNYWWSPILIQLICGAMAVLLQDHFFIVMSLLGNTTITMCTFVMPSILYIKYFKNNISMTEKIICWICVIIGIITGVTAVTNAVINLIP